MKINPQTVADYIQTLPQAKLSDMQKMVELLTDITHVSPKLWGTIIGFGHVAYQYKSGHTGEMPIIGFASRQKAITFYLNCDLSRYDLSQLGTYTTGVGCLYVKKLSDIHLSVLKKIFILVIQDVQTMASISSIIEPIRI